MVFGIVNTDLNDTLRNWYLLEGRGRIPKDPHKLVVVRSYRYAGKN